MTSLQLKALALKSTPYFMMLVLKHSLAYLHKLPPQLRAVLDAGGASYRIANPMTWAQQANLAAQNNWIALKKLQDELSGGLNK